MFFPSSFYLWIATTAESGAIAGIVIGTIFGFLLLVCCPFTICVVIVYCVLKGRSSNTTKHTQTVTQPKVTTRVTTTNTPTLQQKPHSAYSSTGPKNIEPPTTTNTPTPPEKPHSAYSSTRPRDIEPSTTTNTPTLLQKSHSAYSTELIGIEHSPRDQHPAIDPDCPAQDSAFSSAAQ